MDAAFEPRAEHQIAPMLERVHERSELADRIRAVCVGHHEVVPTRVCDPGEVRLPVAAATLTRL